MTDPITIEWDDSKNRANLKKHGVRFEEAASVFSDENARIIADPDHSNEEDRFVILGMSNRLHLLVVCHCYRKEEDAVIRIISARRADKRERLLYGAYLT